jgi:hypothetical protein
VCVEQRILPGCEGVVADQRESGEGQRKSEGVVGRPRYEAINREQLFWRQVDVERLIGAEHPARAVWEFVGKLDMSGYQEEARRWLQRAGRGSAVTDQPGVYAYGEGGDRRAIEELWNGNRRISG